MNTTSGQVIADNMARLDRVEPGDDGRLVSLDELTAEEQAEIYERRAKRLRGEGLTAADKCPNCGSPAHTITCKPAPHVVGFVNRSETERVTG